MVESYPVGESGGVRVDVQRDEDAGEGFAAFSVCLAVDDGSAVVRLPGHYGGELASRIREADEELARGVDGARRTYRDEFLDLTVLSGEDAGLVVSSTARVPLRLSVRLRQAELLPLAGLLERAHELVETLRHGVALVPDRLPDGFAPAE